MIEEAAGTRMYECKKISAQKTIEKKDAKLKEIQTVCTFKYSFLFKWAKIWNDRQFNLRYCLFMFVCVCVR